MFKCIKDQIHLTLDRDIEDNQTVSRELEVDPIRVKELEQKIIPNPNGDTEEVKVSKEFPYHIILDVGHLNSTTTKSITHEGKLLREYDINWNIADKLIQLFEDNNISYSLTVEKDEKFNSFRFLQGRVDRANVITKSNSKPTLLISLHHDAFDTTKFGSTMFIHTKHSLESFRLAQTLSTHIPLALNTRNRGVKTDKFTVLTCLCPAVLIEFEFYDNPYFFYWLQSQEYAAIAGQSVIDALLEFGNRDLV